MKEGDTKTITVEPSGGYGERDDNLVKSFPKSGLPQDLKPTVGDRLQMKTASGGAVDVVVTNVDNESITIDANHPLAGKTLEFEIRMVEVAAA
jgi:peptidylprolyl isomerase/FKBP-type peptidyl-prolyl cis-trans isomerase SlpA